LLLAEELQPMPPITPEEKFAVHVTNGTFVWDMTDTQETKAPKPSFWKRSSKVPSLQSNAVTEDTAIESDPDAVPLEASSNPDGWTLDNINLSVERGSLVVIVGAVGAGKSSLLNAIVGEMKRVRGTVTFGGTIGFCPQTAWIQNATLRDNILFGQEYDEARYRDVIKACALEPDLRILKDGDRTEIGERGVNLSGGQKQRINIARAAYLAPDIVLLDDPMSATDAIVSKHIFEKCIMGLLKDKTKVLITHHLHFARYADQVLVMERGKVVEQGTFNSLMEDKSKFYRLMMEHGGTEEMTDMNKDEVVVEDVDGLPAQPDTVADAVMMTEEKKQGAISAKVYLAYGRAGGGAWLVGSVLLALFVAHASKVMYVLHSVS
jgi:ABC-type multidrug transport system fused ATPase/permease subunit